MRTESEIKQAAGKLNEEHYAEIDIFDMGFRAGLKWVLNGEQVGNVPPANACTQLCVRCPSQDDIDNAMEEYGFQVPYDGSNEFYDKDRMKHFRAGVEFVIQHIKRQ